MKAAVLYGPHDFRIEDLSAPEIQEDECLIKVHACGVCHSEIHQWDKQILGLSYPRFIGHEVAGQIIKAGSNIKKFKAGDRVAVWADGKGYAEEITTGEDRLCLIADSVEYKHALSEPLSCTTNGILKARIQMGDVIALIGVGFMGLILLQQLKLCGPRKIIAIDVREEVLDLALKMGADVAINPLQNDAKKIIMDITDKRGVDICFEVGGIQPTLDLAVELIRMEGKLVIFGYHPGSRVIKDLGYWNWMAFDIINAHFRDLGQILKGAQIGMNQLNEGKIQMAPLITHEFSLTEIEQAFCTAKEKPAGFIKSVITMN